MFVVPPIITANLGKIAFTAAATALGALGYSHRERIQTWLSNEDYDYSEPRAQQRRQVETEARETVQSLKDLHGQMALGELDKKHSELLDKLASLNANAVAEFKGLINDVHEELGSMTQNFQADLDAQRREMQALREAMENIKARQEAVEALVRSRPHEERISNGKGEPASSALPQATGSTAPRGKRKGNGPAGPDSRPA